jgi:outer membrane protein OmpA-like peptidoglycan-associated protein
MSLIRKGIVVLVCAGALSGCAAQRAVRTEAALGRVIIYRNGVAYFERRAAVRGEELTLTVPAERVDDFLKSLRVEDAATGRSLPVSYPSARQYGSYVQMTIRLPKPVPEQLRVSYVTESPAWKPSYRLTLREGGAAKLEAWAIVDNVSGEDWKAVKVGVGSTSALSFRYDLHSIRSVQRETLTDGAPHAAAPPVGGSPYEVAQGEAQVMVQLGLDEVDRLTQRDTRTVAEKKDRAAAQTQRYGYEFSDDPLAAQGASGVTRRTSGGRSHPKRASGSAAGGGAHTSRAAPADSERDRMQKVAAALNKAGHRVRIEGYARPGEPDARSSSLERANRIRDGLIKNGVPPSQIEAVGTAQVSNDQGVRLVSLPADDKPQQAKTADPAEAAEPIGSAYFLAPVPLTIEKDHSAMVSILSTETKGEPVYFYDPISARGSKRFAFNAVRLENPSRYTLDSGPFTVYADGQFLGEGLSEPIPPKTFAFIPYALDKKLIVEPIIDTREEITKLITIERGIVKTQAQQIRRTKLSLSNRGTSPARVFVRHAVPDGWTLRSKQRFEKLRGAHLLPVVVPPRGAVAVEIEESMPFDKTLDIRTDAGLRDIGVFLRSTKELAPELAKKLGDVLTLQRELRGKEERIATLHRQLGDYRRRVDEIHVQLVTLRRVPNAQRLSQHLAKKMEEISERIQKATIEVTDLEGQVLTTRIALEDRIAELTLETNNERVAATKPGG